MPEVKLEAASYPLAEGESVLDCLLRNAQTIPYACKSGVCQACLVKAVNCTPAEKARKGLRQSLQAGGYALACQWVPDANVEVKLPDADEAASAVRIQRIERLSPGVLRLILSAEDEDSIFSSRPGQYLTLINPAGISRSYSIANDFAKDRHFELHVAATSHGVFTHWLFNEAQPGQILHARGPAGDCFYNAEAERNFPLLLVGTGTGLAPLYGIAHDALRQRHKGPITLLHGGSIPERLYCIDELGRLAQEQANFRYQALVLSAPGNDARIHQGDIEQAALAALAPDQLAETRVYLCGAPEFVQSLRKKIFLKGVRSAHIFCDAFVTRKVEAA
jgi:ferredoxin-NADP reductase